VVKCLAETLLLSVIVLELLVINKNCRRARPRDCRLIQTRWRRRRKAKQSRHCRPRKRYALLLLTSVQKYDHSLFHS